MCVSAWFQNYCKCITLGTFKLYFNGICARRTDIWMLHLSLWTRSFSPSTSDSSAWALLYVTFYSFVSLVLAFFPFPFPNCLCIILFHLFLLWLTSTHSHGFYFMPENPSDSVSSHPCSGISFLNYALLLFILYWIFHPTVFPFRNILTNCET